MAPAAGVRLEHAAEKWNPVFREKHAKSKKKEHDAFPSKRVMIEMKRGELESGGARADARVRMYHKAGVRGRDDARPRHEGCNYFAASGFFRWHLAAIAPKARG